MSSSKTLSGAELVKNAIQKASSEVFSRFRAKGGTTLVLLLITPEAVTAASVGDSRLYTLLNTELRQISDDDSIGAELSRLRPNLPRAIDVGGVANRLTQFVGQEEEVEPHIYESPDLGTYTILLTDGVYRMPHTTLQDLVAGGKTPGEITHRLVTVANWCGGRDNASAIAVPANSLLFKIAPPTHQDDLLLTMWDSFGRYQISLDFVPLPEISKAEPEKPKTVQRSEPAISHPQLPSKRRRTSPPRKKWPKDEVQISLVEIVEPQFPWRCLSLA